MNVRAKRTVLNVLLYLILAAVGVTMLLPFLWMVAGSLKTNAEILQAKTLLPANPQWGNYQRVLEAVPFFQFYWNTFYISVCSTLVQLILCTLAAYAFACMHFRGRDLLFLAYLATMMVPSQVTMIPLYVMMSKLRLIDTHAALIVLRATSVFSIFMLRQSFLSLPGELAESARLDGCGELRILVNIVLPLSKAILATLIVFAFLGVWNDYLTPLIYLSTKEKYTIQIGIRYFQQEFGTNFPLVMAATTMSLVPVVTLYLSCQHYFVAGIATAGLKG